MDDLAIVRTGMELLAWEYDDATWGKLVETRLAYRRLSGCPADDLESLARNNPGRVLFSSTGLIFGDTVKPWRGRKSLCRIELDRGGWQALVFTFKHIWAEKVVVPLPPALADHAIAMAQEDLLPRAPGQEDLNVIENEISEMPLFDVKGSGDPVATKTPWGRLLPGGNRYRTYKLCVRGDTAEVKPALGQRIGVMTLFTLGVAAIASGAGTAGLLIGTAAAAGLGVAVVGPIYWCKQRVFFDRAIGFWRGHAKCPAGEAIPLADIHALQIISEVTADSQSYVSWELNVVLESGERVNVMDHGDWLALRADAEELAKFLGVPLWKGV